MSNKDFDNIKVPNNINLSIEKGVKKAISERNKKKFKKIVVVTAASLGIIITLGVTNPALASSIPFVGSVFEAVEKNIHFPANYSEYATTVNESTESNGVKVTMKEILCDGQSLYVTYLIEKEKPFKNTIGLAGGELGKTQLLVEESYSSVNFSDKKLDSSGFAGLEGKFVDEHTFVGMEKYRLDSLGLEVPNEFDFKVKLKWITSKDYSVEGKEDRVKGTWAFKVPVKVDKSLRKVITPEEMKNDKFKVDSISITKFDMIVNISYLQGVWNDYNVRIFDEDGEVLQSEVSYASEDNKREKLWIQAPKEESRKIKIALVSKDNRDKVIVNDEVFIK